MANTSKSVGEKYLVTMPGTDRSAQNSARRPLQILASAALALLAPLAMPTSAQEVETQILPLNPLDRQYMDAQRQRINDVTLRQYGGRCCRSRPELDYLQRLLDDGLVENTDREELQAMGMLMGDLLAAELNLDWVVYEDRKGRSRALRLGNTDNFLFPVTMISRRIEAGDRTSVQKIYQDAVETLEAVRPPLPFQ